VIISDGHRYLFIEQPHTACTAIRNAASTGAGGTTNASSVSSTVRPGYQGALGERGTIVAPDLAETGMVAVV